MDVEDFTDIGADRTEGQGTTGEGGTTDASSARCWNRWIVWNGQSH